MEHRCTSGPKYGLQCTAMSKEALGDLEKTRVKLLKVSAGLHKFCRSTPVLHGMKVHNIDLVRSAFRCKSRARSYLHLLNMHSCTNMSSHNNLIHRASRTCNKYDISFVKYVMGYEYGTLNRKRLKSFSTNDGIGGSVRQLLLSRDPYDRIILTMLIMPF